MTPRGCRPIRPFRLIGSEKNWNRGAALTSTLHGFETGTLTSEDNLLGLMALNRKLFGDMLHRIWALPLPSG